MKAQLKDLLSAMAYADSLVYSNFFEETLGEYQVIKG